MNVNVKGTVYVTGKTTMTAAFGEERWTAFMAKLAEKDKYFSTVIMSITPMPVEKLIVLFDEMCKEFFNDDKMQYCNVWEGQVLKVPCRRMVHTSHLC